MRLCQKCCVVVLFCSFGFVCRPKFVYPVFLAASSWSVNCKYYVFIIGLVKFFFVYRILVKIKIFKDR